MLSAATPSSAASSSTARNPRPRAASGCRGRRFLKVHLGAIAATDFFAIEVLTLAGLVRQYVLFVIGIETRRVQIASIIRQPHGAWMKQLARSLTDAVDGVLWGMRYLIHDRDPLFTTEFRDSLRGAGVTCIKLPARSPDLNAYAERFVFGPCPRASAAEVAGPASRR